MKLFEKALEELKIPKDFNHIHSVSDLIQIKNFGNDINTFFENYLEEWYTSFKMNMDEVLEYIPESELKDYKFAPGYEFIFSDLHIFYVYNSLESRFLELDLDFTKSDISTSDEYQCYTYGLNPYTDPITDILNHVNSTDKVYFVDTTNKEIHVCLDDIKLLKCSALNKSRTSMHGLQIGYSVCKFENINTDYIIKYTFTISSVTYRSGSPQERSQRYSIDHKFNIDSNTYTCEQNIYHQSINTNAILEEIGCKWLIDGTNGFNVAKSYINKYLCKKN